MFDGEDRLIVCNGKCYAKMYAVGVRRIDTAGRSSGDRLSRTG